MRKHRKRRRFRFSVLIVAFVATLLGAYALYGYRTRQNTRRLLDHAKSAAKSDDWADAAVAYRQYMQRKPNDVAALQAYADVLLEQLKTTPEAIDDATRTLQRLVVLKPDDVDAIRHLTNLYLQLHKYEQAEKLATDWSILSPESADAALYLALAQHRLQEDREAAATLLAAIGRIPGEPRLFPLLIKLLSEKLSRPEEAGRWLDEALQIGADDLEVQIAAFTFFETQDQPAEAEAHLKRALELAPDSVTTLVPAGAFYLSRGRLDDADRVLSRAALVAPKDANVLTLQASLALKEGNTASLMASADRFFSLAGDDHPGFLAQAAELYLRIGALDRVDSCLSKLREVPAMPAPVSAHVEAIQGGQALRRGEPYEAIKHLHLALEQNPSDVWGLELLATANERVEDFDAAADAYRQIMAQAPKEAGARLRAAELAWRQGRLEDARNIAPSDPTVEDDASRAVFAMIRLACDLRKKEREGRTLDPAGSWRDQLERIATDSPADALSARWLMRCFALTGQPDRALGVYRQCAQQSTADADLNWEIGNILLSAGQGAQTLELSDELIKQFPVAAEGYVLRTKSLASLGRLQEAASAATENDSQPASVRTRVMEAIADAYLNDKQVKPGLDWYRRSAKVDADNLSCRRKLIRYTPDIDEALGLCDEIRAHEGEDGVLWRFEKAGVLLRFRPDGEALAQTKTLLQHCIADRPGWLSARLLLGYADELAGNWQEAADAYEYAMGREPSQGIPPVGIRLVGVLKRLGKLAQADALLDSLARLLPDEPAILRLKTEKQIRVGDLDSAIETSEQLLSRQPDDPALAAATSELYLRVGNPKRAETIARSVLADHPDSTSILWSLAQSLIAQGRSSDAEREIRAAADGSDDAFHALLLASVLARIGKDSEAAQSVAHAQALAPKDDKVWAACADFWSAAGERAQQIVCTLKAIELRGEDPDDSLELARLLSVNGSAADRARAAEIVKRRLTEDSQDAAALRLDGQLALMQQPPELTRAETSLERSIAIDPNSAVAYKLLSSVQVFAGHLKAAQEVVERGLAYSATDTELLQALARIHSMRGQDNRAIPVLERLLELRPRQPVALRLFANACVSTGQADKAIAYVEAEAPEKNRTPVEMIILANLYEHQSNMERAERLFHRAESMAPASIEVHQELLQFMARRGDLDGLHTLASAWLASQPDDVDSLAIAAGILCSMSEKEELRNDGFRWLDSIKRDHPEHAGDAEYRAAACHYELGDLDAAEKGFLDVLQAAPTHSRAVNDLAWLYAEERGEPEKAVALIERFVSMGGSEDAHLLDTHSVALIDLGRFDDAEKKALQCLEVAGNTPTRTAATYHLGIALVKRGLTDTARPHLREALQLQQRRGGLTPREETELRSLLSSETTRDIAEAHEQDG